MQLHKIPSLKLVVQKINKGDKDGYIYLRCGIPQTKRYVLKALGHKIPFDLWDKTNEIVKVSKEFPNHARVNSLCKVAKENFQSSLDSLHKQGKEFTEPVLRKLLLPEKNNNDFIAFFRQYLDFLTTNKSKGYIKHFEVEIKQFKNFAGDYMAFEDVTTEMLQRYEISLSRPGIDTGKIRERTTINSKMKKIKDIVNRAIDRGLVKREQVTGYKFPKYVQPDTEYLTIKEVEKISAAVYSGEFDNDHVIKSTACYFLVECLSGIRFSDWRRYAIETLLKDRNFKVRAKKNGEPVYLPLNVFTSLAKIVDYIHDNNIKFDYTLQSTNRILKDIARNNKVKINKTLSTHVGRRTCGTMLAELGYSTRAISEILGISENTAKVYIKNTRQSLNNEFERNGGF